MSKVTEELDFMWEKRVLDYYNDLKLGQQFESNGNTPFTDDMRIITNVLKLQGLTVRGIEG